MVYKPVREAARTVAPKKAEQQLLRAAAALMDNKQTEQALVLFRRALASNPRSAAAQLGVANAELQAGREMLAAAEFERVIQLDPGHTTSVLQLAKIYSTRRETWELAEKKYREYLAVKPKDAQAQLAAARVFAWQGKAREAADMYSVPVVSPMMTPADRRSFAFALMKSGQLDRAEVVLKELQAANSADFELRLQLANLYAAREDWDSALPSFHALLRERPDDANVNLTYGLGLQSKRDYRAALEPLRKARTAMPGSGEAGLGYARALKGVHNIKGAASEFGRVLPHYRNDPAVVREYADLLFEKGDARNAAKHYLHAHALGLRDTRLLVGLSGSLLKQRKPREALPYLERAYRQQPTDRLAFELAKAYHAVGKNQQALAILNVVQPASATVRRGKP